MTFLPILTGKLFLLLVQLGNFGRGSTWPGHIALKYNKHFVKDILRKNPKLKVIIVVGTNGKTTTSQMIHHILEKSGKRVFQNKSGANLLNGIASTVIDHASISGEIPYDFAIFEVDENALPQVLKQIAPIIVVLLNLFRDQLDRYGELNTIQKKWENSLLDKNIICVTNADDPRMTFIASENHTPVRYFGVKGKHKMLKNDAADSLFCPRCGNTLTYTTVVYSHLGDWYCKECKLHRPSLDIERLSKYPLEGTYNEYNANAAVLVCTVLGISKKEAEEKLSAFKAAFGRQEIIKVGNKNVQIFLSKNPASFNQSLETIMSKKPTQLLLVLNDRIPDGRDVSWIWDTDIEEHDLSRTQIYVSGDRYFEMALRMKYAGKKVFCESQLTKAISDALIDTPPNETLYILPTYSAMLDVRKVLTGRKIL